MSKQPEELTGFRGLIVHAVGLCEVERKPRILYNLYLEERMKEGRGMEHGTGRDAFDGWRNGRSIPDAEEFFFFKRAVNRRLLELGKDPLFADEPFPRFAPEGDGDGASNGDVGSADGLTVKGGHHPPELQLKAVSGF